MTRSSAPTGADWVIRWKDRVARMRFDLGNEAQYAIRFGYRKQPYQWAVISDFMDIAGQVQDRR